jgi:electron transfer flavoprotein beta subunit
MISSENLILTGSQAIDDVAGEVAPYLAEYLSIPFLGVISEVKLEDGLKKATVTKEFSGGLRGEFKFSLPAVVGIQSAEKPPRYVPIAKIRSMMKSAHIEEVEMKLPKITSGITIEKLFFPEATGKATILDGTPEKISEKLIDLLTEHAVI